MNSTNSATLEKSATKSTANSEAPAARMSPQEAANLEAQRAHRAMKIRIDKINQGELVREQ
jgi:hypothetical protein